MRVVILLVVGYLASHIVKGVKEDIERAKEFIYEYKNE